MAQRHGGTEGKRQRGREPISTKDREGRGIDEFPETEVPGKKTLVKKLQVKSFWSQSC